MQVVISQYNYKSMQDITIVLTHKDIKSIAQSDITADLIPYTDNEIPRAITKRGVSVYHTQPETIVCIISYDALYRLIKHLGTLSPKSIKIVAYNLYDYVLTDLLQFFINALETICVEKLIFIWES
ncbi:hypothetical protein CcNV_062 [Crangon crangon nudivirus]|uniref:Uncharacterized protein n=1 Tax=Crangon crangon nudivirus TaxID=2880838 RepID=A0AAE8Y2E5_9VIRU|nr:hypothetical protein QKT25_gp063 [Crangon crangon nudivirus]UBZ25547.1 hypothetical protein CcNV_062 [Crangon crangon nudivirus]